jgi:hypothetical protein
MIIKQGRRRVIAGVEVSPNMIAKQIWRPTSSVKNSMHVPVSWQGHNAEMYFKIEKRKAGFNRRATDLFNREGFSIYGSVVIEVGRATWNYIRVIGSEAQVRSQIDQLALARYEVIPAPRDLPYVEIFAEADKDIMTLKMALSSIAF